MRTLGAGSGAAIQRLGSAGQSSLVRGFMESRNRSTGTTFGIEGTRGLRGPFCTEQKKRRMCEKNRVERNSPLDPLVPRFAPERMAPDISVQRRVGRPTGRARAAYRRRGG